jgi:ribose transport system substrate-binding protein
LTTGSPVIAIEIPHPGVSDFGVDNDKAGLIGRRHPIRMGPNGAEWGRIAQEHWVADTDETLMLELSKAGKPASRLTGMPHCM